MGQSSAINSVHGASVLPLLLQFPQIRLSAHLIAGNGRTEKD
jgi:hypothetical protein